MENHHTEKSENVLHVQDLRVSFRTGGGVVRAVDGVTFDVPEGAIVALVGESGSGKSTAALAVAGLIDGASGTVDASTISFDGRDLMRVSRKELTSVRGKDLAMIFQDPATSLNPTITVGRQIIETLLTHHQATRSEAKKRACRLLEQVGVANPEGRLDQYPHQFSGGMQQRVMIAIALSCNPKLIIADEPTTALDVTIQAQILDLMKRLADDRGVGFLLISHNLGLVARYADFVNVMYAGRIVESGEAVDIYHRARHPYTIGLLNSVPRIDTAKTGRLQSIDGQPPDLARLPVGCAFRERCPHAMEVCAVEYPPRFDLGNRHGAACWLSGGTGR